MCLTILDLICHYPESGFLLSSIAYLRMREWAVDLLLKGGGCLQPVPAVANKELVILLIYCRALRLMVTAQPFILLTSKYRSELCRNRLLVRSVIETCLLG